MEIYIQKQLLIILYSLLMGLIFGAGYDIIRILHIMLGKKWSKFPVIFLLDICYMFFLTCCYSAFVYAFNNGVHRLFILIPIAVGFTVYYNTVGRVVIYFSEVIIRFIKAVVHYVIVVPAVFMFNILVKTVIIKTLLFIYKHTFYILFRAIGNCRRRRYTLKQRKLIKKAVRI